MSALLFPINWCASSQLQRTTSVIAAAVLQVREQHLRDANSDLDKGVSNKEKDKDVQGFFGEEG